MAVLASAVPSGASPHMAASCKARGCRSAVPAELERVGLCILHFVVSIEETSAAIRRETALRIPCHEREVEIIHYMNESSELLARAATAGICLPHATKMRILSTFLTLMNLRENLDHAAQRQVFVARPLLGY